MLLLMFTLLASLAEVFSIAAVLPFLGVLTDPERVFKQTFFQPLVHVMGVQQPRDLLLPVTLLFCVTAQMAGMVRIVNIWLRTRLTFAVGADLSNEIYRRTLYQSYSVHLARNSSEVIDGISSKVTIVIYQVLNPILLNLSNFVILIVILLAILLYEPVIALVAFGGFGIIYGGIYLFTRARLRANSRLVAENSTQRMKALQEGLGGIRDVLLDNTQEVYCAEYRKADIRLRRAQAESVITSEVPRFAVEALGMCFIALLAFSLSQRIEGIQAALPMIGAIAIAAQRILPLLQQIYYGLTNLSGSEQSLLDTLLLLEQPLPPSGQNMGEGGLYFNRAITCRGLGFRYSESGAWVIRNLNLQIPKGGRVGFIGSTGSGKSTLLDLLMGLLEPTEGSVHVDDQAITLGNSRQWQARIAHVPQVIYLSDASIAENIAFGVPLALIDMDRVRQAAIQAQIATTIDEWPKAYETLVGERGVRLSGGQRQRIGIARAFYKQADLLLFDEATSALDTETEGAVMQCIETLGRGLTILIVAHRLSTLRQCDVVVEIAQGNVSRSGSFGSIV